MEPLSLAGLALLAFAATNLDNLLLLVAVVSRTGQSFAPVLAGVLLWSGALLSLCVAAAFAADLAPQRWVGTLGFVPLGLGIRELLRLVRARPQGSGEPRSAAPIGAGGVAGVMLANSADSLGALVPLFAESRDALLAPAVVAVLLTSLLGCGLARWIAAHERLGPPIRRFGPRIVPFALIAVGLYVLSNTGTDTQPG